MLFLFGLFLLVLVYLTQNNIQVDLELPTRTERFTIPKDCTHNPNKKTWDMSVNIAKTNSADFKTTQCLKSTTNIEDARECILENNRIEEPIIFLNDHLRK